MDNSSDQTPTVPIKPGISDEAEIQAAGQLPAEPSSPAGARPPDFDLEKINALAAAWNGLAAAIQKVNDASASAEAIYRRGVESLQNQLELTRELIKGEENAALARLKSQRKNLSPEEYADERQHIENAFGDEARAAESQTNASGLALKFEEQANLQTTARQKAAEAEAIKPPADDPAKAQVAIQRRAELRREATEAQEKAQTLKNELPEEQAREHTRQIIDTLNSHGGKTNQALGELATTVGLTEQQKLTIVERILNHQLSAQQAWAGLEWRLAQLEAQQQNNGNRGMSQ